MSEQPSTPDDAVVAEVREARRDGRPTGHEAVVRRAWQAKCAGQADTLDWSNDLAVA